MEICACPGRFKHQCGAMKIILCIAAFGAVVAPAAGSGCGSIDSASVFGSEDTLLSCNGDFLLSR